MLRASIATALLAGTAVTTPAFATAINSVGDVFVIDMENHNLVDPNPSGSAIVNGQVVQAAPQQLKGNVAAPYLNSLMTKGDPNATQTSWASNYLNVLPSQGQGVHPSEPNYLWQEAGTNFPNLVPAGVSPGGNPATGGNGVRSDAAVSVTSPLIGGDTKTLSGLLQKNGTSWTSYQEDTDLQTTDGKNGSAGNGTNGGVNAKNTTNNLTSTPVDMATKSQYTVPLVSLSGTSSNYTNQYNGSHQYDFATKHDGQLFFDATNGITDHGVNGGVTSNANGTGTQDAANPLSKHYAPLQQLQTDLDHNSVSRYNLITPDQFNDMHTALNTDFTYNGRTFAHNTDQNAIAVGDNFLSIIIPKIMASQAYLNNGAIIIWFDETEPTATTDAQGNPIANAKATNADAPGTTLAEIVISPLAKGNAFEVTDLLTHTSDLFSLEQLFGLGNQIPLDPRDSIPTGLDNFFVPEPTSLALMLGGIPALLFARRRKNVGGKMRMA